MKFRKVAALLATAGIGAGVLAGCGSNANSASTTTTTAASETTSASSANVAAAAAPGVEAGFEEFPVGDDLVLKWDDGELNVAGVYFQPVDLEPSGSGLAAADANFHIEADISAGTNDVGYEIGSYVPQLTVDYEIIPEGSDTPAASGTFMDMNASDGPHYGANVALKEGSGKYKVRFIIKSPAEKGWTLHVDEETGVKGRFWNEPLVAEWDWDYVEQDWNN